MSNPYYRDLVRRTRAPIPVSSDRTLYVEGMPSEWPCEKGACLFVARYVLRAAFEQNCVYIEVRQGANHKHRFDVGALTHDACQWLDGWVPSPQLEIVPVQLATQGHCALGAEISETRPMVSVPSSFCLSDKT